jgi:small subunit ribosomal protein S6
MNNYELLYIVSNKFTEAEVKGIKEKVDANLTKYGAVIGYQEILGRKKLAYPIDKNAHGHYVVTEFELEDGPKIAALTNDLRLDKEVLRAHIITKVKITPEEIIRQKKQNEQALKQEALDAAAGDEEVDTRRPAPRMSAPAPEKKKVKNLDDKLEEILKDDVEI